MLSRRVFLASGAAALIPMACAVSAGAASKAVEPGEDGLYNEPWFLFSFLDLRQDAQEAAANKKRLAVLWSQRACPYCKQMHESYLTNDRITNLIRENFEVVHLNLFGSREVTDFDGKTVSEKELARRWGVIYTPTVHFFGIDAGDAPPKTGRDIEGARMSGLYPLVNFYGVFSFARIDGWKTGNFRDYMTRNEKAFAAAVGGN